MEKLHNKNQKSHAKKYFYIALVVLIISAAFTIYILRNPKVNPLQVTSTNSVNYDPPTEEEKTAGDRQKEQIVNNDELNSEQYTAQNNDKKATVIITDAAQYDDIIEVRSWITNHFENGKCTILFTQGGQHFTKEMPAYVDAHYTICTNPLINRSEFPSPGEWNVTVEYKSNGATGISDETIVVIR